MKNVPDDRERERRGGNERDTPVAQEEDQDENRQEAADEDRVTDAGHRGAHERREVVHDSPMHSGRQRRAVRTQGGQRPVGDAQDVAADLARHADDGRRLAVAGNQRRPIHDALAHLGDIADIDGCLVPERDDNAPHIVEASELGRRHHEELVVVLRQPPDGGDLVRRPQRLGHLFDRQLLRVQPLGIDDDGDLALVAGEHLDVGDARDAAQERPELEHRDVAQVHRRDRPCQVDAEDRKQRRGHPFGRDRRVRRQRACDLVGLRLHELQGVRHVGVGVEEHRDLGGPADGSRSDAPGAEHAPRRLLERPRDREHHQARCEIARVRHDDDARELDLGVDVAGQAPHFVEAGRRDEDDAQEDGLGVACGETRDVHCLRPRRTLSPSPCTAEVRTVCPSVTPEATSTASGISMPIVTAVRSAVSPPTT